MSTPSPKIYCFKDFTLDLDRACLLRLGDEVKLRPKVFEVLKYLVQNTNRLITKDELIKAIWADAFVTDDSLVQCLVEIRRALGDEAQGCIKTVPRRGYIFEASVTSGLPVPDLVSPVPVRELPQDDEILVVREPQGMKSRQRTILGSITVAAAVLAAILYLGVGTSPTASPLTDKDTVLIVDFVNGTEDEIFDGTLKQALAVQLGQAPFLNIFAEERIRETLRYMKRSPDERLTKELGREIAQRQGIKALLSGSISALGSHYVISLEAMNVQNGDVITREQVEADNREQVLRRIGEAVSKLRAHLGESLSSIEKYDTPIEQATTPSLEALKAFSLGRERQFSGKYFEAIPFYRHAVELDPNFAIAYAALAITYATAQEYDLAAQFSQKAFDLRARTSERERFYISARYYMDVEWDADKNIEVQELWKQTYPRDFAPRTNLSARYCAVGQFERGLEEARESVRLNPDAGVAYAGVALSSICLNRYDDAKATLEQAMSRNLQPPQYRFMLYSIALLKGDTTAMQQHVDAVAGTPLEAGMLAVQSVTAASAGQLEKAGELTRQAVDLSVRLNMKEAASQHSAASALWEAAFGNCREAKSTTARALSIEHGRNVLTWSAFALALCGDSMQAESLMDEMIRRFPHGSFIKAYWVPMTRAALELNRNNPAAALQLLESSSRGETGTNPALWPAYLRGMAYLRQHAGMEATREFQRIVDHQGVLALAPGDFTPAGYSLYPLAHLGLARASAMVGDTVTSRKEYEVVLALWKDADSNNPLVQRTKQEYSK